MDEIYGMEEEDQELKDAILPHYQALVRSTIKYLLEVYDESTTKQQTIETPAIASPSKSEPRSEDRFPDDYEV